MKILLLVAEPWRSDSSGGNVIDNLFRGINAEYAQVYCSAEQPNNISCDTYYQFTSREAINSFITRKPCGHIINSSSYFINDNEAAKEKRMLDSFRSNRLPIFITAKYLIWRWSNWKTKELSQFITGFQPDVIFAPCYASPFMCALTRFAKDLTKKPVVSYSGDDNYSLKQFSISPAFWINRIIVRKCLRKTYPYYDAFYSMSEDEIQELTPIIVKPIKILRKGIDVSNLEYPVNHTVHHPIRLIYAGGIYVNRWKTLSAIRKAIERLNEEGYSYQLDIYTQNTVTNKQYNALNNNRDCFLHKSISKEDLEKIYHDSDIAIHCESFSLKNKLLTRLSFSTKIVDCLASGCAILAIAWKEQTGLKYLQANDAAICITSIKDIYLVLKKIANNTDIISKYANNARMCAINNHNIDNIRNELMDTLEQVSSKEAETVK